jgi:hypothetical protein
VVRRIGRLLEDHRDTVDGAGDIHVFGVDLDETVESDASPGRYGLFRTMNFFRKSFAFVPSPTTIAHPSIWTGATLEAVPVLLRDRFRLVSSHVARMVPTATTGRAGSSASGVFRDAETR